MKELLAWYIAGPVIGCTVPLLLIFGEKQLGVSSSFRFLASFMPIRLPYLDYDRNSDRWQLFFVLGIVISALSIGFLGILPDDQFFQSHTSNIENFWIFMGAGIFIGFGSRLAGGCTAGHCIMGIAQFSPASILSTAGFFLGGWLASNLIVDLLFN